MQVPEHPQQRSCKLTAGLIAVADSQASGRHVSWAGSLEDPVSTKPEINITTASLLQAEVYQKMHLGVGKIDVSIRYLQSETTIRCLLA